MSHVAQDLIDLCKDIDKHLPDYETAPRWAPPDDVPWIEFRNDTGAGFSVRTDIHGDPSRVVISGLWPESVDIHGRLRRFEPYWTDSGYNVKKRPRITCAKSRGAGAIASDIAGRFLPTYLPYYDEAVERKVKALESAGHKDTYSDLLVDASAGKAHKYYLGQGEGPRVDLTTKQFMHAGQFRTDTATFKVDTYSGLKVHIEIRHAGLEQAELIMQMLANWDARPLKATYEAGA